MEENEIEYNFSNMPLSWQVCFLSECPVKEQCLRQLAAQHLDKRRDFGPAVYPTMEIGEKGCRLFATGKPKRMAWGFSNLFAEVKSKDETGLRNSLKQYLGGHGSYYRYNRGERLLTPEQQTWIINLFRRYGYVEPLTFDHFAELYDFGE